ncbi:MAG: 7-cyano-7-deazaguanine synthase QueC [Phycisphaerales bacterium]|nr:7-cyano-7-deazaguanine synthase QueC [Phycisphaerales bacterium]
MPATPKPNREPSDGTQDRAVVLLSGGLDSATVLAIARRDGFMCHALSIDYGQRHRFELECADRVARALGAIDHKTVAVDLRAFGGSALTAEIDVPTHERVDEIGSAIPVTYVPARNLVLLSLAIAYAETLGASDVFIGVNAVDYSGYPDCRPAFVSAFENVANLATKAGVEGRRLHVNTPIIEMSKAEIIRTGTRLGVDYALTTSCYNPPAPMLACGHCDSCLLRRQGFEQARVPDPTRYAG